MSTAGLGIRRALWALGGLTVSLATPDERPAFPPLAPPRTRVGSMVPGDRPTHTAWLQRRCDRAEPC